MSETLENKKIQFDILEEKAQTWWDLLEKEVKDCIINQAYMKRNGITNSQVEW